MGVVFDNVVGRVEEGNAMPTERPEENPERPDTGLSTEKMERHIHRIKQREARLWAD